MEYYLFNFEVVFCGQVRRSLVVKVTFRAYPFRPGLERTEVRRRRQCASDSRPCKFVSLFVIAGARARARAMEDEVLDGSVDPYGELFWDFCSCRVYCDRR